jgi:hypothetical protein
MDHFIGCDLGKMTDPTALAVLSRSLSINADSGLPDRSSRGDPLYRWECRAIKRYKLGTPYLSIVADVLRVCNRRELQPRPRLVLDSSGVGVAVSEMFVRALVDYPDVECHSISITAGEGFSAVSNLTRANLVARGQWRVAKIQLIAAIREVLESRRFKVSKDETGKPIQFAEVLVKELTNFRERITESANMTYEARQGQHDDLVLATCLPIWLGSQRFCRMRTLANGTDDGPMFQAREAAAMDADNALVEKAEAEALKMEREGRSWSKDREKERLAELHREFLADPHNPKWYEDTDDDLFPTAPRESPR